MERKANEMMGVTFNGQVTFQGPMFDIHDNKDVHIEKLDKMEDSPACDAPGTAGNLQISIADERGATGVATPIGRKGV